MTRPEPSLVPARLRDRSGVTLIELMIAAVILAVVSLGLLKVFGTAQRAIQLSKNKTLASNLAQEKMQVIKQKPYYEVIATRTPSYHTGFTPTLPYDTAVFPLESILQGGVRFERLTYVTQVKEDSGALVTLSPSLPDTGLKNISVTVIWREGSEYKKVTVTSVMANINTPMTNSLICGTITNCAGGALNGALAFIAENQGWRDTTSAAGQYCLEVLTGTYNLWASFQGFVSARVGVSVAPNATKTQDVCLTKIASGTVVGVPWMNPRPLISQVVVSTKMGYASNFDVEYVELFNPTDSEIQMDGGTLALAYGSMGGGYFCSEIALTYVSTSIPVDSYYLVANTSTFMIGGRIMVADAYYQDGASAGCSMAPPGWGPPASRTLMARGLDGNVTLLDDGATRDTVGWKNDAVSPAFCEGTCVPLPAGGLAEGQQLVRYASTAGVSMDYGSAYNSGSNAVDFLYPPAGSGIPYRPRTVDDAPYPVIAGVPAVGAVATCNDGLSESTQAYSQGSPPYAYFRLTSVALLSGDPWTLMISTDLYSLENGSVSIAGTGSVYRLPDPALLAPTTEMRGYISGSVTDCLGNAISAPTAIVVSPGAAGANVTANTANGRYLLSVTTGYVSVTANPDNENSYYLASTSNTIPVEIAQITPNIDFMLGQGARISGFVTRDGTNGLPGFAVAAIDSNDVAHDQPVTDINGRFTTAIITTGTYFVTPVCGSLETSAPSSAAVVLAAAGSTVFSATFTISGALGTITGRATAGGEPVSTGVLIVVTTMTLAGTPPEMPTLSSATLTSAPYYAVSTHEDGTYEIEVRQGSYNIYGYYTTVTPQGAVTINAVTKTGKVVTPGETLSGEDFAW